ncbi:MAG: hypothetical protein AABY18_00105 [Candidatus Thermoplasmatota archaeon]
MRTLAPVLLASLLLAGFAIPLPVLAQGEPVPLLTDSVGDVHLEAQGQASPALPLYPGADLVALSLIEAAQDFTFILEADDLRPANEETGADGVSYAVTFTHNGREFMLQLDNTLPAIAFFLFPLLAIRDTPTAEWSYIWADPGAVTIDYAKDLVTLKLPRDVLADAQGAVPYPGRALTEIRVHAESALSGASIQIANDVETEIPFQIIDDMPALDAAAASYDVQFGVLQTGHARLWSDAPFRSSNGEATTYVFEVEGENLGDEDDVFDVVAVGVPSQLTVVVPVPLMAIDGEESTRFPVLVTVPFGHAHGSASKFTLELRSHADATAIGRLEMGVRFLAVPQPAGHHDTVYLHTPAGGNSGSVLGFQTGSMNTLEDDPDAVAGGFHSTGGAYNLDQTIFSWTYALAPALEIGLDIDLERNGAFAIPISTTLPMFQASMRAELYVEDSAFGGFTGGGGTTIATIAPTAPVDMAAQSTVKFEGELIPDDEGDEVSFEPGRNLFLFIELSVLGPVPTLGVAEESPAVEPGSWLRLPVNEWHDPVDEALASVDGPSLEALSPQERLVNPGEAVVFAIAVENPLEEPLAMRLAVTGANAAWATISDDRFVVPAEDVVNFTVTVRAPAGALPGERADLIVQAYPRDEPEFRGLLRVVAIVDSSQDFPDEAPASAKAGSKGSPPPSFAVVALAVLALALTRRR